MNTVYTMNILSTLFTDMYSFTLLEYFEVLDYVYNVNDFEVYTYFDPTWDLLWSLCWSNSALLMMVQL